MSEIIIFTEKNNMPGIKEILKTLTPDVEVDFIWQDNIDKIKNRYASGETHLIFNNDYLESREACKFLEFKKASFGFSDRADFFASDQMKTEDGISFKLNYKGHCVTFWIKSPFDNEKNRVSVFLSGQIFLHQTK